MAELHPFTRCSNRLAAVQKPIIPVIAGLIRQNPGTISLGQGVVSYGPPKEALDDAHTFGGQPDDHKYKPVQGIPSLVQVIRAKLARENRIDIAAEQIYVTAGGNQAFANALLAIADPGDEIILLTPYYFNHEMAITMANCVPVLVPTDHQYQPQLSLIAAAITPRTRAIVTVSPNNPTGAVYSEDTLRAINELGRARGIYHIHDEAYEYFIWDRATHFSPGSIQRAGDYTISLFSLSKAYGFASWRIGYMTVPPHLIEAVNKIHDTIQICAPVISQVAACEALKIGKNYYDRQKPALQQSRNVVAARLATLQKFCEVQNTEGAFYYFLKIHSRIDPLTLATRLIQEYNVAVIPGTAFGMTNGCYLRIAYGALTQATVEEGINRFVAGIEAIFS